MLSIKPLFIVFLALSIALPLEAQEPSTAAEEIFDMGLEDLMKVSITGPDRQVSPTEAPALITIITREQIKSSAARSLIDVFQTIPSFQMAVDYNGVVALGVRGMWAIEGKVQYMIDGIEMADLFYNSAMFWYSFPIQQISRIEIIRGPGSVIYGNAAEYAVINVITLSAEELSGASATLEYGRMEKDLDRKSASIAYGNKFGEDWDISAKIYTSEAGITGRDIHYAGGATFPGQDTTQDLQHINLAGRYKGFSVRFLTEILDATTRDASWDALTEPSQFRFLSNATQLQYKWKLSENLNLTPTYSFRRSSPYRNDDPTLTGVGGLASTVEFNFDYMLNRHKFVLPSSFQITKDLNLLTGFEYSKDTGETASYDFFPDKGNSIYSTKTISFETHSLFSELTWKTDLGLLSGGGRYESHNEFGEYFVPRLSWIHQIGQWNFKALYSFAYRNPSIGNYSTSNSAGNWIEPEKARVVELETGYRFSKNLTTKINLFDIQSKKTLVFDPATSGYINGDRTGTKGVEVDVKYTRNRAYSQIGMTYFDASNNKVSRYAVPQDSSQLAGFSNFKLTWDNKAYMTSLLSAQVTAIHRSDYYGFSGDINGDGALEPKSISNTTVVSLFLNYENLFFKGFQFGVGVANMFDAKELYSSAYDLGREPLPAPSREILARINYRLNF